jgi:hypothetical protein
MAFGDTPLIDNFNRADSALASSACSNGIDTWGATSVQNGAASLNIVSNQVDPSGSGNCYIQAARGPACEVYATIADPPDAGGFVLLLARIKDIGASTWDGYYLFWVSSSGWEIRRVDNNAATTIAGPTAGALVAGDKMGFELIGSTLTGYRFTGGSWVSVLSVVDATYLTAGFIGFGLDDTGGANLLDDFGGGTTAPVQTYPFDAIPFMSPGRI